MKYLQNPLSCKYNFPFIKDIIQNKFLILSINNINLFSIVFFRLLSTWKCIIIYVLRRKRIIRLNVCNEIIDMHIKECYPTFFQDAYNILIFWIIERFDIFCRFDKKAGGGGKWRWNCNLKFPGKIINCQNVSLDKIIEQWTYLKFCAFKFRVKNRWECWKRNIVI